MYGRLGHGEADSAAERLEDCGEAPLSSVPVVRLRVRVRLRLIGLGLGRLRSGPTRQGTCVWIGLGLETGENTL